MHLSLISIRQAVPPVRSTLIDSQFQNLAHIPTNLEWFTNLTNTNTRRASQHGIQDSMAFTVLCDDALLIVRLGFGIRIAEDLRFYREPYTGKGFTRLAGRRPTPPVIKLL